MRLPLALLVAVGLSGCFPFFPFDDDEDDVVDTGGFVDDDDDGDDDGDDDDDGRPDGDPNDPGEQPVDGDCEQELRTCLEDGVDPRRCDARYRTCLEPDEADSDVPPEDPEAACRELFDVCADAGLPEDFCGDQLQDCLDVHAADPCEAFAEACIDLGLEPAYCREAHEACLTRDEAPAP